MGPQGTGMKEPGLKIKISPTAPFTHPSLSSGRVWWAGVVLTVLWALHRPHFWGLCSQGHWKVGNGEESSWEMPKAGYLEMILGGKKRRPEWEAFESWVIKQEWRKAKSRSNPQRWAAPEPQGASSRRGAPIPQRSQRLVCNLGVKWEGE